MKTRECSIVFIGTSSGTTCLNRFHSALLVKSPIFNLLIDCGDGTSKALVTQNISLDSIDGILFSHLHPDHSAGFPSFIVQLKQLKRVKPLKIFCHKNLTGTLRLLLQQTFVFEERSSFDFEYLEFEHGEKVVLSEDFSFIAKQNSHLDNYIDFLEDKVTGFASSSFLLELGKKRIYYSGDLGSGEDLNLFEDFSPEIIITEAAHIEFNSILEFIENRKPEKVYLTHLDDELERELKQKVNTLPRNLQGKIVFAQDGLCLKI